MQRTLVDWSRNFVSTRIMSELTETALHEAGHAVANLRLDIEQAWASIEETPERLGAVSGGGTKHVWNAAEGRNQVLAYCAGYAALIAAGIDEATAVAGAENDFDSALELIESWRLGGDMESWKQLAVNFMSEPRNVRAVRTVADRLECERRFEVETIEALVGLADGDITDQEFERFLAFRDAVLRRRGL